MTETKITGRQTIVIASLIFGVLFGAGNLIFPVHLGQLAGAHWLGASSGFLISGVLLPLMALLAISITRSNGIYDLARPNGHYCANLSYPSSGNSRAAICDAPDCYRSVYNWFWLDRH